jgi:hypothetical protein
LVPDGKCQRMTIPRMPQTIKSMTQPGDDANAKAECQPHSGGIGLLNAVRSLIRDDAEDTDDTDPCASMIHDADADVSA